MTRVYRELLARRELLVSDWHLTTHVLLFHDVNRDGRGTTNIICRQLNKCILLLLFVCALLVVIVGLRAL